MTDLTDAEREWIRERARRWAAANHDKIAAKGRRYREKHAEREKARVAAWGKANPERRNATMRAWRAANPERDAETRRRFQEKNPEKGYEYTRKWNASHPEQRKAVVRLAQQRYRALKKAAQVGRITPSDLSAKMAYWGERCWMCGGPFEAVDHVKPLSKGGSHVLANLRPACMSCNSKKKNHWYGVHSLCRFLTA